MKSSTTINSKPSQQTMDGSTSRSEEGVYGLKQAGIIANQQLTKHLATYGYSPTPHTPGLWRHSHGNATVSLVLDDFGVKYVGHENAQHIVQAVAAMYTVSTDWTGSLYCGLTIKWNYPKRHVNISMPGYVDAALHKFNHPLPKHAEDTPQTWNQSTC
jgi:hypothetical protein